MTLLAVLVSLWIVHKGWTPQPLYQCRWGQKYLTTMQHKAFFTQHHPALAYGTYLVVPVGICWYIQSSSSWLFALTEGFIVIVLLLGAVDYRRLDKSLEPMVTHFELRQWQAAYEYVRPVFDFGRLVSPAELLQQTVIHYWLKTNQLLFAPLFWLVIFGPAGLALYLFTKLLKTDQFAVSDFDEPGWKQIGIEFLHSLEGLPARALALTIAGLTRNKTVLAVAVRRFRATDREAEAVIRHAVKFGLNFQELPTDEEQLALKGAERIRQIQQLRRQVLVVWLVVIALLTIVTMIP